MNALKLSLIQTELHWENPEANQAMMNGLIEAMPETDIIVLPEMWNTGFSNKSAELSETMDGPSVTRMRAWAKNQDAVITGSLMISEGGKYYNRMLWVQPDGAISCYDKRHLFRLAGEQKHFEAGQDRVIVKYKGWRIMLQVCYDLRFPVFARNQYMDGRYAYDLILYVANWPGPRHLAWETLLRARAIENLTYCLGVNRVGTDENGLQYNGGSAVVDYKGEPLVMAENKSEVLHSTIDLHAMRSFRDKFPTGLDADAFSLKG